VTDTPAGTACHERTLWHATLIAIGIATIAYAFVIAATGGFAGTVLGLRMSSRRPVAPLVAGWLLLFYAVSRFDSRRNEAAIAAVVRFVERRSALIGAGLTWATFAVALMFGAFVAAGADPYAYVSQAALWADGNPVRMQDPLALHAPWDRAPASFCPLGYRPGTSDAVIVPVLAPGLPLQMAGAVRAFGSSGAYLIVPVLGAVVVGLTYRLARQRYPAPVAITAAGLVSLSPVFVYQLMLPMTDVPVTAWWLLAVDAALTPTLAGAVGAGLSSSLAVLTRPNLVPLIAPLAALVLAAPGASRMVRVAVFALGVVPGVGIAAAAHTVFYGGPLRSGYGSFGDLFDIHFAAMNVRQYADWMWQTHSPLLFVALVGLPVALAWRPAGILRDRRFSLFVLTFSAATLVCYVFYLPFNHWTYLRFLLPAIPFLTIESVAIVWTVCRRVANVPRAFAFAAIVSAAAVMCIRTTASTRTLSLKPLFTDRYIISANRIRANTPPAAAIMCLLQSGSLRTYASRLTVRYDLIDPSQFPAAVEYLRRNGRTPFVVLETTELDDFRQRFAGTTVVPDVTKTGHAVDPLGLVVIAGPLK
jgi:hypothetical protein